MNLLSSLNISQGALSVNEKAISVVSHNVANMNTRGYHKQRVNLQARNIAGQIGDNPFNQVRANGGVMIANVMRYNDDYLNNYYRQQLAQMNMYEQQLGNLDDLANIFNDLEGTGIDGALSNFYDALNNLNQYPASATARANFIESAKSLTSIMNSKSVELSKLTGQALGTGDSAEALAGSRIYAQYREFNNCLEQLAEVNKALQTTQTGTLTANNLLDQRDLILHDLAQFVDFTTDEKPNGTVDLYIGDIPMVKGSTVVGSLEIQTAKDYCANHEPPIGDSETWQDIWYNQMHGEDAVISIVNNSGDSTEIIYENANGIIQGGALGGLIHSATDYDDGVTNAGTVQAALDTLAGRIAELFNNLNTRDGAYCIDPNDTNKLTETNANNFIFQSSDGGPITAANITIADNLRTNDGIWDIACAYFADPAERPSDTNPDAYNAVGNSFNVIDMVATRTLKEPGVMNGMSLEDFYSNILGKVASAGDNARSLYETQCDVVDSLESQLDAAYGVDLNEELVDLVKYQTAYAAAAQVFNVVNSCLDTLVSLGR